MNPFRRTRLAPARSGVPWADTLPSRLPEPLTAACASPPAAPASAATGFGRLDGLDVHELEGQTVFDQFFGPTAQR